MEDIIDVFEEEATEDMYRMIGVSETEKAIDPFWRSVRNRLIDLSGAGGGDDTIHRGVTSGAITATRSSPASPY